MKSMYFYLQNTLCSQYLLWTLLSVRHIFECVHLICLTDPPFLQMLTCHGLTPKDDLDQKNLVSSYLRGNSVKITVFWNMLIMLGTLKPKSYIVKIVGTNQSVTCSGRQVPVASHGKSVGFLTLCCLRLWWNTQVWSRIKDKRYGYK